MKWAVGINAASQEDNGVPKHSDFEPDYFLAKGNGKPSQIQLVSKDYSYRSATGEAIINPLVDSNIRVSNGLTS